MSIKTYAKKKYNKARSDTYFRDQSGHLIAALAADLRSIIWKKIAK